jgi:hypothetical protein
VNQTIAVCLLVVGQIQRATHVVGYGYAMIPPRLIYLLLLLECEHTHSDRAYLVVATCDELTRTGKYIYNLSLFQLTLALDTLNGARKNPRVTT